LTCVCHKDILYLYLYFAEGGFERYILHDVDPVPCADLWRDVYIGGRCAPSDDSLVHIARVCATKTTPISGALSPERAPECGHREATTTGSGGGAARTTTSGHTSGLVWFAGLRTARPAEDAGDTIGDLEALAWKAKKARLTDDVKDLNKLKQLEGWRADWEA
jgi:hypothetical protein